MRVRTVDSLLKRVYRAGRVLVRAPPARGKSALAVLCLRALWAAGRRAIYVNLAMYSKTGWAAAYADAASSCGYPPTWAEFLLAARNTNVVRASRALHTC